MNFKFDADCGMPNLSRHTHVTARQFFIVAAAKLERIFRERMTSNRKLKASRDGSK